MMHRYRLSGVAPAEVIDKVLFLTQGKLLPDYSDVELGIADKVIIKTLSLARM